MPTTPAKLTAEIEKGKLPAMILVGGNNEFLVDHAFLAIRDALLAKNPALAVQNFGEVTDLTVVIDDYRTFSLFAQPRLLVVPEVNAFISRKELLGTYEKAVADWKSAKTDRKRDSSLAKLLHTLGLAGLDTDMTDGEIARGLGVEPSQTLSDMLAVAKAGGKRASRGESDAALLAEAANNGGAPNTVLLMRTGAMPDASATIDAIDRAGAVVVCDLSRDKVLTVLERAIREVEEESGSTFDDAAVNAMRQRLGIDRMLADKFSKEIPDIRNFVSEATRLATYAGEGKRVTTAIVNQQIAEVAGGARFEFASLVTEGKAVEAVAKLRDLVAQSRRDDPAIPVEVAVGRFIFPLADELRQMLAIQSFCRQRNMDTKRGVPYPMFKDQLADAINSYLVENGIAKQRAHPFPLHKRFEASRRYREQQLVDALAELARLEVSRKSGGTAAELGLELAVLRLGTK
ncbi:MAG: hypothetical protein WC538_12975 [Thermoanaerobaculia bacterium]|jgi:DNA polymerase III delta subunit